MRRILLFAAAVLAAATPAMMQAQGREITGKVTQAETGQPLADATIGLLGQPVGVRTNERGEYRLRVPAGTVTILARAIGFKRISKQLGANETTSDFVLEKDVLQLEGVTVTGQATTVDKRNATTAIASVSAEELNKAPAKTLEGNLAGKVTGARIFENGGNPGGGMQIQIRGVTSVLGSGDPLYVIDGVIVSNASTSSGVDAFTRASGSTSSNQDQVVNRLADINPNDIESIEVLKSAAASAIYGSRATNGVVVITTKKGKAGQTRFSVTQRIGSQDQIKDLSSRRFANFAAVAPWTGGPVGTAAAQAACNPTCPWYDWQKQLYNQTAPSFETVLSASGGVNNTRFFASLNDRTSNGIERYTNTRRTSARLNLDQTVGDKLTISGGIDVTHNNINDGLGNNDNAGVSPIYEFGYSPAIVDLQARQSNGLYVNNPFNGGGTGAANPFQTLSTITNNESVWRETGNVRVGYSLFTTAHNTVQLSYLAGVDRYQQEGYAYSPGYEQYEAADGFLGTVQQSNASSFQFNHSVNGIWTWTPGWKWLTSAQTSVGGSYENQYIDTYRLRAGGLIPTVTVVPGAGLTTTVSQIVNEFRDQSLYANEQIIAFDEKLSLAGGLRADRSSANGDREKFYAFPKVSGSYRFTKPFSSLTGLIDEVKFRAAWGESGNRPRYGDRDVTLGTGSTIGGQSTLFAQTALGNPAIKPEVMTELEFGTDMALFDNRVSLEATHYERKITDLLLTFPLAPTSGLSTQVINGGQMSVNGFEGAITIIPIRKRDFEWTFRTTFGTNVQHVDNIPVPAFAAPNSFGSSYGRNRIEAGTISTLIWGNNNFTTPTGVITRDTILKDSNPRQTTQFLNQLTWKSWSLSVLLDWRNGGYTSDMTKNLFDEGGQSRDYDNPSGVAGTPALGLYRYQTWQNGNITPYIDDGTYVKLRELTIAWTAPKRFADLAKAREMRFSLSGRNLAIWSKYWSYDPEFSNFGNQNFNRFIDLAPYPSARQFFFSVDLGY